MNVSIVIRDEDRPERLDAELGPDGYAKSDWCAATLDMQALTVLLGEATHEASGMWKISRVKD